MTLKEDAYPVDPKGRPDLTRYADPLEHYLLLYEQYLGALGGRKGPGYEIDLAFRRRAHATWGLIAKGIAAVPHALAMLKRREREAREDGAAILAALGQQHTVVSALLQALEAEDQSEPKDSMILALGQMRSKEALPALARIGGGIGGLAAALSLLRTGIDVHVYEQARGLTEVGPNVFSFRQEIVKENLVSH